VSDRYAKGKWFETGRGPRQIRRKMHKEPGQYGEEKERRMELKEGENWRKDNAQQRAMKSSFIHAVSSNYQCINSIP